MWQFLQTYGIWILFIIFLVLMMRMHGGGMHGSGGHGRGHDYDDEYYGTRRASSLRSQSNDTERVVPLEEYSDSQRKALAHDSYTEHQHGTQVRTIPPEEGATTTEQSLPPRRRRGC